MSSTLADLQKLNLKKMEDAEAPQDANTQSNEVSIIPSKHQSNVGMNDNVAEASNDVVNEVSNEATIIPSTIPSRKPSKHQAVKTKPRKSLDNASAPNASLPSSGKAIRTVLEVQIREHLIEQLMPQNGKGPITRLNVEMPEDLHQQLKQHCVRTRTPIKGLINALIAWYLEAEDEA